MIFRQVRSSCRAAPAVRELVVLVNNQQLADRQDLLTQTHAVPEPGTLALLALGLIGLAWSRQGRQGRQGSARRVQIKSRS